MLGELRDLVDPDMVVADWQVRVGRGQEMMEELHV